MGMLRVIFDGLLVFARREKAMSVILLSADEPQFINGQKEKFILQKHFKLLRIRDRYVGESRRVPDAVVSKYGSPEREFIYFLGREQLAFKLNNAHPVEFKTYYDPSITMNKPDPSLSTEKYLSQKRDFRWVVSMEKACEGCGTIDGDCINANIKTLVGARIELDQGTLGVLKLSNEITLPNGRPDVDLYKFASVIGLPEHIQALSRLESLEVAFEHTARIVSSKLTGGPSGLDDIVIVPGEGGWAEVSICNIELESLFTRDTPGGKPEDFYTFYELAKHRPPDLGRRVPSSSAGTAGERLCPSAQFG